ncbi:hemolysin D [Oscillatoriales cyanobacterium USR001]|nr:hemolysin D [Oscillatoriales cyanobacterium USR001]
MVHRATVKDLSSNLSLGRQLLTLVAITTVAVGGGGLYYSGLRTSSQEVAIAAEPQIATVTALGRLEPQGEAIALSASSSAEGNRIEKLLVKEGDWVKTGQTIAILDSRDRLQAALEQAQEQVQVAIAKLATVKAGAKTGEIQAQEAAIARLQAERSTDIAAAAAVLNRLEGERITDIEGQKAAIARIQAEKQGEIQGQKEAIVRLKAELENAKTEAERYEQLNQEGAISTQQRDSKQLTLETAQQRLKEAQTNLIRINSSRQEQLNEAEAKLNQIHQSKAAQIDEAKAKLNQAKTARLAQIIEAQANLDRISEIRPTDIQTATAEVNAAKATVKQAQANLDLAYIHSPKDAQVLKIYSYPGEKVSNDGIVQLGQTRTMYAIAEVYESDIEGVKIGQKAKITSTSFRGELQGTVEQIGLQVLKQNVINTDPSANIDGRIIEVKIRLNETSSPKVAGLTNLQVKVVIEK